MCDPITLGIMAAGTGASVLGGGMSSADKINNDTNIANARNAALKQTNATDLALSAKSRGALGTQLGATTGAAADAGLQGAQGSAVNTITGNMAPAANEPTLGADMPTAAKSGLGAAIAGASAKSLSNATAKGNLLGYQTYGRTVAEGDKDLTSGIDQNNNFVHGNMAILPSIQDYEQIKANKPSSGLGELLQGLGSAAGGYAGQRSGMQGKYII